MKLLFNQSSLVLPSVSRHEAAAALSRSCSVCLTHHTQLINILLTHHTQTIQPANTETHSDHREIHVVGRTGFCVEPPHQFCSNLLCWSPEKSLESHTT